jgi:hypothetical protein
MDVSVHREPLPLALNGKSKSRILIIGIVDGVWRKDTRSLVGRGGARKISTCIQTEIANVLCMLWIGALFWRTTLLAVELRILFVKMLLR